MPSHSSDQMSTRKEEELGRKFGADGFRQYEATLELTGLACFSPPCLEMILERTAKRSTTEKFRNAVDAQGTEPNWV